MKNKNFNDVIVELRKSKGLTQQELAQKLNVTDKAVSKWERGLSYPDITSISTLAKVLEVDSSYLIDLFNKNQNINSHSKKEDIKEIINIILLAIGIGMSIGIITLNILNKLDETDAISMLAIGLFSISIYLLSNKKH